MKNKKYHAQVWREREKEVCWDAGSDQTRKYNENQW